MHSTTRRALALGLAAAAVAACGSDGSDGDAGASGEPAVTTDGTSTGSAGASESDRPGNTSSSGAQIDSTPDDTVETPCEATVPGSAVTFSALSSTGLLDPTLFPGGVVGGTEAAAIYDTLFTYDYETNTVEPHLAEAITPNADYTKFTLELRDGITYSDGTPLDARMVAANLDRYFADHATAPQAGYLALIDSKRVVDPTTLEITMKQPWAEFPSFLAEQVGMIVNTKAIGDDVHAFATNPPDAAGVGPYVLERNAPNEEIVLKARDDYWGGPVCIETLRVIMGEGGAKAYDAFKSGQVDIAFLRDSVSIASAIDDDVPHRFVPVDLGVTMVLNLADGHPANDRRLREAIWRAIDPEAMNDRAYQGTLSTGASLIHPDSVWASDGLATVDYDPERARQLVDEAEADGVDATLEILTSSTPTATDAALAWEGMLAAVGFDVTVRPKQINDLIADVFAGNFDGVHYAHTVEPAQVATRLYGILHSTGVNNRGKYQSPEMDAAVAQAMAASTDERAAAVAKVNDLYVNDFVSPVLGLTWDGIVWQDHVHGVVAAPAAIYLFHDAYIDG